MVLRITKCGLVKEVVVSQYANVCGAERIRCFVRIIEAEDQDWAVSLLERKGVNVFDVYVNSAYGL